jgi:hypothetical protein
MDSAETAFLLRHQHKYEESRTEMQKAFELERNAALLISKGTEPSRSVLLRSAASLALNAGLPREAERMISIALSEEPPPPIAEELRDLLEQVNFERHLQLRDVTLAEDEVQMSLSGPETGFGVARSDEFIRRIQILELMAYRTAERQLKYPFREKGRVPKDVRDICDPYVSVPRAASFAVTVRFGIRQSRLLFASETSTRTVIDDLLGGLELINVRKEADLRNIIKEEHYYNNMIALAKKLSPDLKNVRLVGLTTIRGKKQLEVAFTRASSEIQIPKLLPALDEGSAERVQIVGRLEFASVAPSEVKLTSEDGTSYEIIVPRGVLADLVKPYWEQTIRIIGNRIGRRIYFEDIEKEE